MTNDTAPASPPDVDKLLAVYLRDHLAGAMAGLGLAQRCRRSNEGTRLGDVMAELEIEIAADRDTLKAIMERLDVPESHVKKLTGRAAEIVARLKNNGRLVRYSPSSRVVELETLAAGVITKRSLWTSLLAAAPSHPHLEPSALEDLIQRATAQYERIAGEHDRAASRAFVPTS